MNFLKALIATTKNMKAHKNITNSITSTLDGYISPCVKYYTSAPISDTDSESEKILEIITTGLKKFCNSSCNPLPITTRQQINVVKALYPIYGNVLILYQHSSNFDYNNKKINREDENKYIKSITKIARDNYIELLVYTAYMNKCYLDDTYKKNVAYIYDITCRVGYAMNSFMSYADKVSTTNIDVYINILNTVLLSIIEHVLILCDLIEYK